MINPHFEVNEEHIPDQFSIRFEAGHSGGYNNWAMSCTVVLTKDALIELRNAIDAALLTSEAEIPNG